MGCTTNKEEELEANNWEFDQKDTWDGSVDEQRVNE